MHSSATKPAYIHTRALTRSLTAAVSSQDILCGNFHTVCSTNGRAPVLGGDWVFPRVPGLNSGAAITSERAGEQYFLEGVGFGHTVHVRHANENKRQRTTMNGKMDVLTERNARVVLELG